MLILTLAEKGGEAKELSFEQTEIRVGRVRDNEIVLPKGNVSKHHCRLLLEDDQVLVEDLGSTNGTYVNGRRISEPTPVTAADRIFVGDFILRMADGMGGEEAAFPQVPSVPEAGSLSTALPRRPLPPPPPMRSHEEGSGPLSGRTLHGEGSGSGRHLHAPPPPPPPPAFKRESKAMQAEPSDGLAPPAPTDISLDDDEELSPAPRINLPPLKPPTPVFSPSPEDPMTNPRAAAIPHEAERPAPSLPPPTSPPRAPAPSAPAPSPAAGGDTPAWLSRLLGEEDVRAVFFSGTNAPEIERQGGREPASVSPADLASLSDVIRRLVSKGLPRPEDDASVVNTTLDDGTRIAALFPPMVDRLLASIQPPLPASKSLDEMAAEEVLSPEMQEVLEACVNTKQNILLAGDRAACDALLGTLTWSLDRVARVVVLAETINPPASATGWAKLPIANKHPDLVAAATGLRPEYVVADTAAAGFLPDLLQACMRGQNGVLAAMVARSGNGALSRLRTLAAAAGLGGGDALGSSLDLVVHVISQADGSFKIMEIAEPALGSSGELRAEALLTWQSKGKGKGRFVATRTPSCLAAKLEAGGVNISDTILQR
jgi:pilus assembly protein CpaF